MNMDQTPRFHAMDFRSTIDMVCVCMINLHTTASDSKHVTVAVMITASRRHVKSMVVFNSSKVSHLLIFNLQQNITSYHNIVVCQMLWQARAMDKLLGASCQPCPPQLALCMPTKGLVWYWHHDGMGAQCSCAICATAPPSCCSSTPPQFFQGPYAGRCHQCDQTSLCPDGIHPTRLYWSSSAGWHQIEQGFQSQLED